MAILISHSAEETFRIAEEYAKTLKAGDVVRLDGEMGAGKTVFAKGVAKGLGVREEVTSPTYAYMNDYSDVLYHYDCYRIDAEKAEALGLSDYFYAKGVCLVEWAENIEELLPLETKRVFIRKLSETQREITL